MKKLEASALPTVLVISVLICLLVLFAFVLFDINALFYSNYHYARQQKEHLNSAFVLYCNDSTLLSSLGQENEYLLYKEDQSSQVRYEIRPWGFYEYVTISTQDEKFHSTRLIGKSQDCEYGAALWVCNRDMALSLAGTTEIKGPVYIPINGINYIQLGNEKYQGQMIDDYYVDLSEKELPDIDSSYLETVDRLRNQQGISSFPTGEEAKQYHSFKNETLHFSIPENTDDLSARGNIVLHAGEVTISSNAILSDVILVAKKVTIEDGFAGSLQIIASDTVIIEDNVHLRYPSGIYLNGNKRKTYLSLANHSRVDGYAIVMGNCEGGSGLHIDQNYRQKSTATFQGLLYVDGIADVSGEIYGAAYIKECYYLPENGIYAGTLHSVKIHRSDKIAYPLFFSKSMYKRKEIKTVY
jgi:hypothetical protein